MDATEKAELIKMLNESHEHFIEGLLDGNGVLTMLAYRNYTRALATVFDEMASVERHRRAAR